MCRAQTVKAVSVIIAAASGEVPGAISSATLAHRVERHETVRAGHGEPSRMMRSSFSARKIYHGEDRIRNDRHNH